MALKHLTYHPAEFSGPKHMTPNHMTPEHLTYHPDEFPRPEHKYRPSSIVHRPLSMVEIIRSSSFLARRSNHLRLSRTLAHGRQRSRREGDSSATTLVPVATRMGSRTLAQSPGLYSRDER